MKKMMMVGLAVIGIGLVAAQAGGLACAIDAALQEKDGAALEWAGHKFRMRPVEMTDKDKRTHVLTGTLEYVNGKKDQNLNYRITKTKGAVTSIEVQVDNGMWPPISQQVTTALGDYCKTSNVEEKKQGTIHQALYKAGEDSKKSWTRTAELIVAFIAIRHC
jgi:hypothetical protein